MILGDNERFIIKCELDLIPFPKDAPKIPLKSCMPVLHRLIQNNTAFYNINNGKSTIRLLKVIENPLNYILLFQHANTEASDPAFAHTKTGKVRVAKKEADEGVGVTAHVIIAKEATNDEFPDIYPVVIEEVPGITKTMMSQALTYFFRQCGLTFQKEGSKNDLKCRGIARIEYLASSSLQETLSQGHLLGILATRKVAKNCLDEDGDFRIDEEYLKISTTYTRGQRAIQAIKHAHDALRGRGYSNMRITYKDKNKRTGSNNFSLTADQSVSELATARLAERVHVILGDTISICQEQPHEELLSKMQAIMLK